MSVIKIDNVTKKYGKNIALDNVSAEIENGRIYGLLGRNGAGKSTMLNIITNRVFATSGVCTLDGEKLLDNDKALSHIYAMNEAVTMPLSMTFKRCMNVTADFYKNFDKDYAFSLAEKFRLDPKKRLSALSTGYLTIAKIILTLSSGADFLFFDEPVLGLDANHRDLFYRLLVERFADQNCGIVISTHLIEECQALVENVIMINKGKIIAAGATDDILSQGYSITGAERIVTDYCRDKTVLSQRKMGTICSAYLKGKPENVPDSLEVSRPDLQQVFINLTGEEGEQ
ncbi:ATP-binding cassette domain-containing protein [Ruminococcus sp.]